MEQTIERAGGLATSMTADVSLREEAARVVGSVVQHHGRLDILVNDAGLQHVSPIETFPIERWRYLIDVMLVASTPTS